MDRERLTALLESVHSWPTDYRVQLILRQDEAQIAAVLAVLAEQVGLADLEGRVVRVPSRKGSFVALRVELPVKDAAEVLAIYERLSKTEGLLSWF